MITGGANGIGEATAELFGREGAAVVVVDIDQSACERVAQGIRDAGGKAIGCAASVLNATEVEAAVHRASDEFGGLDHLVCCAGVTRDNLVFKMSDDDWSTVINTHLSGTFYAARAAQAVMVPKNYGKIVLISSTSALGNRGQTNYSTAKAGLQGMARTLAIELGRYNINVNVVAPGFVETRMTMATAERMGIPFEEYKQRAADAVALRRVGQPIDIANVIAFLCSDDSSFVTGQTIYVAGSPRG
jgi:3-oxoacyl-[acyl-carrier protein] reductase